MLPDGAGGPLISPIEVPPGNPGALSRAAAVYTAAQGEVDRNYAVLINAASQANGVAWTGFGAASFASAVGKLAAAYSRAAAALGGGAVTLRAYATDLAAAQHAARQANAAVATANATAQALTEAEVTARQAQVTASDANSTSATADATAAANPHSPAAAVAASRARTAAGHAQAAAGDAVARVNQLSARYDADRTAALRLCSLARQEAARATTRAAAGFDAAAAKLAARPTAAPAAAPSHAHHSSSLLSDVGSFFSSLPGDAVNVITAPVNALASLGNAAVHDPAALGATLLGAGLTAISAGGEGLGTALAATGVGAPAGAAIDAASASGLVTGGAMTAAGATALARDAAGSGHVSLMNSGDDGGGTGGAGSGTPGSGQEPAGQQPGEITGYTQHGLDQALSRDGGVGVSDAAMNDAVQNPIRVTDQPGGKVEYIGKDATVILNSDGKVITTWANNSAGWRNTP